MSTAEPNEVHDPAKAAAILQEEEQQQRGQGKAGPAAGVPGGNAPGQRYDVVTGTNSSSASGPGPQARLETPEFAPGTHEFSRSQFAAQSPDEDVEEAARQAAAAGYAVVA